MKIFCLGDSLTFGLGVPAAQRWTTLLSQSSGCHVVNLGVSGDTSAGMLMRLHTSLLPRFSALQEPPIVIVIGGSNDIFYSGTDSGARANLGVIAHQLAAFGAIPVIGIPPYTVPDNAPKAWNAFADYASANAVLKRYGNWIRIFCQAYSFPTVDFCQSLLAPDGKPNRYLLLDGLHPTAEGHKRMAAAASATLSSLYPAGQMMSLS